VPAFETQLEISSALGGVPFTLQTASTSPSRSVTAITLFGEGEEKRDHVLVDDVAALAGAVLHHRSTGTLNIATGRSVSFREVAEMTAAPSGRSVEIHGTPRQNPITHRHFDITDCLNAFPEFHYIPLRDGLARAAKESAEA